MLCSPMPTSRTSVTGSLGRGRLCTFVFGGYVTGCVMGLEETRSARRRRRREEEEEEEEEEAFGNYKVSQSNLGLLSCAL